MDHPLERLSLYIDGECSEIEKIEIADHLAQCPSCAEQHAQFLQLRATLKAAPLLTPPESFYAGVHRRLQAPKAYNWSTPITALASACLAVMVGIFVYRQGKPSLLWREMAMEAPVQTEARPQLPSAVRFEAGKPVAVLKEAPAPASAQMQFSAGKAPYEVVALDDQKSAHLATNAEAARGLAGAVNIPGGSPSHQAANGMTSAQSFGVAAAKKTAFAQSPLAAGARRKSDAKILLPWKGVQSGIHSARAEIVRDDAAWQALWQEHAQFMTPAPAAPSVDFSRYSVIAVFAGDQPSGGYRLDILHVQFAADAVHVQYRLVPPPTGMASIAAITQPFEMRVIPRTDLPVSFVQIP